MTAESYISRTEHEEFAKRIEEQNKRQDARLKRIETDVSQMNKIAIAVEKLAVNMENMSREQARQGQRLDTLDGRDGERWRMVVGCIITAIVGLVIGIAVDAIFIVAPNV